MTDRGDSVQRPVTVRMTQWQLRVHLDNMMRELQKSAHEAANQLAGVAGSVTSRTRAGIDMQHVDQLATACERAALHLRRVLAEYDALQRVWQHGGEAEIVVADDTPQWLPYGGPGSE